MSPSKRISSKKAAAPKKAAAKKAATKKAAAIKKAEDGLMSRREVETVEVAHSDLVQEALDASVAAAQEEAEMRRDAAQRLVDEGYKIIGAGQDEDGRHWFEVVRATQRPSTSSQAGFEVVAAEGSTSKQVYIDEEKS